MNRHLRALLALTLLAGIVGALVGAVSFGSKWPETSENVPLLVREMFVLVAFAIAAFALRPSPRTRITTLGAVGLFAVAVGRWLVFALTIGVDWHIDGYGANVGWQRLGTSTFSGMVVVAASAVQLLALTASIVATNRGTSEAPAET